MIWCHRKTPKSGSRQQWSVEILTVQAIEDIKAKIEAAVEGAQVTVVPNDSPANQPSLLLDAVQAAAVASFLRDDAGLAFDYCSNATGVDWPDTEVKTKVKKVVDGVEKDVEEVTKKPGCLEAVYHLYSMSLRHGPLVIRLRTQDRKEQVHLPSLTTVWRSCEFQEREIYDLYGIIFDGHPDLRRILMWDEFKDFPMRKDYVEPDDFEYEPTPHDDVLTRAKQHYPQEVKG